MNNAFLLPLVFALAPTAISSEPADASHSPQTGTIRIETVRTDQTALSRSDRARAQTWGLSETEWRRYRSLMQGIRGSVSPETISPIEVLGIHARDDAERRRYAELWAQAMWEDAERILAFQRAYVEAGRRLYPGVPLIDPSRLTEKRRPDRRAAASGSGAVLHPPGLRALRCVARAVARPHRADRRGRHLPGGDQAG